LDGIAFVDAAGPPRPHAKRAVARSRPDRAPPVALDPATRTAYDPSNATASGRVLSLYGKVRW